MNYKTTIEGASIDFALTDSQLNYLESLQSLKIKKIEDFFEKTILKPNVNRLTLTKNKKGQTDVHDCSIYLPITCMFNTTDDALAFKDIFEDVLKNTPKIVIKIDNNNLLTINQVIHNNNFLNEEQYKMIAGIMKARKTRVKNLFMNLYRESDVNTYSKEGAYCIKYNYAHNKIDSSVYIDREYFTPYYSHWSVANEVIEKYRSELEWYYKEYTDDVYIEIELEEK